ncbi:hypothetical protein HDK90DRAFT_498001 [Phyllosticta capitalensis]|uniref:Cytochrome c oxidase-assembly factor COX23, mitochondrial n=1 Tax=Phyllosticta capitalensis TaxID=121624 RepID=A0ABR1YBG4_9PEZI
MAGDGDNENPWTEKTAAKFNNKSLSEYYDPCQEAATRSIRCLHRNGGDRDLCSDYFQAYRDCKKQWVRDLPYDDNPSDFSPDSAVGLKHFPRTDGSTEKVQVGEDGIVVWDSSLCYGCAS